MQDQNIVPEEQESSPKQDADLMSAFEQQGGSEAPDGSSESDQEGSEESRNPSPNFEIDERFRELPERDAIIRTAQSRVDKTKADLDKVTRELSENTKIVSLFDELLEDDEVFEAFVAERKPELMQSRNSVEAIEAKVKQAMKDKYGDYRPTRDEADEDPGGKAWLYFKDLENTYGKFSQDNGKVKTLKEVRAERKMLKEQQKEQVNQQMDQVKQQMKWDDAQIENFQGWAKTLTVPMLAKMYNFALKTSRIPDVTGVPGSPTQPSAREQWLKDI